MGEQVRDQQGALYSLGNELGEGGQGKVFEVDGHPRLVVKRFHDRLLASDDCEPLYRKVAALQEKRLDRHLPEAAWPQFPVFAEDARWCGYAMRKVKGVS